jgi:hypothetical protein
MPRPQLQTVALRTRPSVFVCAESPAPDSLVFVQNNGWEWAPSGRKLGGNNRSTDNLPARQWPARVLFVFTSAAFTGRLRANNYFLRCGQAASFTMYPTNDPWMPRAAPSTTSMAEMAKPHSITHRRDKAAKPAEAGIRTIPATGRVERRPGSRRLPRSRGSPG